MIARAYPAAVVRGVGVASGVPEQPIGLEQTRAGACRRAHAALAALGADWGLGLEGGVHFDPTGTGWLCGVVAVATRGGASSWATGAWFPLPPAVAERVRRGEELGPVMDAVTGRSGIKAHEGAIGVLTRGLVTRTAGWEMAAACALAPFLRPDLYGGAVGDR